MLHKRALTHANLCVITLTDRMLNILIIFPGMLPFLGLTVSVWHNVPVVLCIIYFLARCTVLFFFFFLPFHGQMLLNFMYSLFSYSPDSLCLKEPSFQCLKWYLKIKLETVSSEIILQEKTITRTFSVCYGTVLMLQVCFVLMRFIFVL